MGLFPDVLLCSVLGSARRGRCLTQSPQTKQEVRAYVQVPAGHRPEQHCAAVVQADPDGMQLAA